MSGDFKSAALVLAAGKGARMGGRAPKVLFKILGSPMLAYVLEALRPVFGAQILIASGFMAESLEAAFPDCRFIRQERQLGTGHALQAALPELARMGIERVLVTNGDAPLLTTAAVEKFLAAAGSADIAFGTIQLDDPGAYGRVCRGKDGKASAIVEAKDYQSGVHGAPTGEVNAGIYLLRLEACQMLAPKLRNDNKSGEFYITDLIGLALAAGLEVDGIPCGGGEELLGVNSPLELAAAEDIMARRSAERLLAAGVVIHHPASARISPFARVEAGAEISGPAQILGRSVIAAGAEIGPFCVIEDSGVGPGARIWPFSHLQGAAVGAGAIVGPCARLRPGARLGEEARVGNFVEVKNAVLGKGAKASHLSYLGDAEIGAGTNIGAGTITCNYDGKNKHKTSIGENVFIGSDAALVAPVRIGDGALVAAGSVVTEDVPPGKMAIARKRQEIKERRNK